MTRNAMTFSEWAEGFERLNEACKDALLNRNLDAGVFADFSLDPDCPPHQLQFALEKYAKSREAHRAAYAAFRAYPAAPSQSE